MIEIAIEKELRSAEGVMGLNLAFSIEEGDFLAIAGKSGSGKTTLLRIIAGLESAQGTIRFGNELWLNGGRALAPQKRGIGFVFQDFALFENMSVEENLLFANNDRGLAKYLLEITELSSLAKRLPTTLSGGQKQRVSLCRAMMNRPKLLLMDEPLSALDPSMRVNLQNEILQLHKEFQTTTIMVSHDPSEIYKLANRMILIEDGKILQNGRPKDILLKSQGSQKLSFEGELIDIIQTDILFVAVVAIGQQIVEVAMGRSELEGLHIGDRVTLSTKAFAATL